MRTVFLREWQHYTRTELASMLATSSEKAATLLGRLKKNGVVKILRADSEKEDLYDLAEEGEEIFDPDDLSSEYHYVFVFVGVVVVSGIVLICYPKYIVNSSQEELIRKMKQVLRVIRFYSEKESQTVRIYTEPSNAFSYNRLAIIVSLLEDYYEYGIYESNRDVIEKNGNGRILWDKTINETFAYISENRPYYLDLYTHRRENDQQDFFTRLHESVLTSCSKELGDQMLCDLFEVQGVALCEESPEDLGDRVFILDSIEKELPRQFHTRKQRLLKMLYAYIGNESFLTDLDCFSVYGTNSFQLVWESVLREVIGDELHQPIRKIWKRNPDNALYTDPSVHLIDCIAPPWWVCEKPDGRELCRSVKTLIPDIARYSPKENRFYILDAKYYLTKNRYDMPLSGQPGIESITKQYLYQLAYKPFLNVFGIASVCNCFLMPTDALTVEKGGYVRMDMFRSEGLALEDIRVRFLPAEAVYELYCQGRTLDDLSWLQLN